MNSSDITMWPLQNEFSTPPEAQQREENDGYSDIAWEWNAPSVEGEGEDMAVRPINLNLQFEEVMHEENPSHMIDEVVFNSLNDDAFNEAEAAQRVQNAEKEQTRAYATTERSRSELPGKFQRQTKGNKTAKQTLIDHKALSRWIASHSQVYAWMLEAQPS